MRLCSQRAHERAIVQYQSQCSAKTSIKWRMGKPCFFGIYEHCIQHLQPCSVCWLYCYLLHCFIQETWDPGIFGLVHFPFMGFVAPKNGFPVTLFSNLDRQDHSGSVDQVYKCSNGLVTLNSACPAAILWWLSFLWNSLSDFMPEQKSLLQNTLEFFISWFLYSNFASCSQELFWECTASIKYFLDFWLDLTASYLTTYLLKSSFSSGSYQSSGPKNL